MKYFFLSGILLFPMLTNAQDTWETITKEYLTIKKTNQSFYDDFDPDGDEKIADVIATMSKSLKSESKNSYLLHILTILKAQREFDDYHETLEEALESYGSNSLNKALLLMEVAKYSYNEENPFYYKGFLDKATLLLEDQKHKDYRLDILLLKEYATLYPLNDSRKEPILKLRRAIKICEEHIGKENILYTELIEDLSYEYEQKGEIEEANKLKNKSEFIKASITGANQPYSNLFEYDGQGLSSEGLTKSQTTIFLLAQLFVYTNYYGSESYFNEKVAMQLYETLFKSFKTSQYGHLAKFGNGLAWNYFNMNNYAKAVYYYNISFNNYSKIDTEEISNKIYQLNSILLWGVAYYANGNYHEAYNVFTDLYDFAKNSNDWRKRIIHNLILTSGKLDDTEAVKKYTNEFLKLKNSVDDENPEILRKYGQIHSDLGLENQAYDLFKKAYDEYWSLAQFRQMDEDDLADDFERLNIYSEDMVMSIGTESAELILYENQKIPIEDEYMPLLNDLAVSAYKLKKYDEASIFISEFINEFYTEIRLVREEALMFNHKSGTDLFEIYKLKQSLFPKYDLFQNIIIKTLDEIGEQRNKNLQLAYNQILDSKSNIQFELRHMRKVISESSDSTVIATYKLYQEYRAKLASIEPMDESKDNIIVELNNLRLELSTLAASFKPVEKQFTFWIEIKNALKRNEAAIEFKRVKGFGNDSIYYLAYIIKPNSEYPELVVFPNGNRMENKGLIRYKNSIKYKMEDYASFEAYWKPLSSHLRGVKKIFSSPDGVFHQVNLNTLLNPETRKYLADESNIISLISTKQLTELSEKKAVFKKATLIGRPKYDLEDFNEVGDSLIESESQERALTRAQIINGQIDDLPGTEAEVKSIERILSKQGIETKVYIGVNSTEENFKEAESNLLHIATHGFWFEPDSASNADAMFQSGLLLAGVKNHAISGSNSSNDGILTAYEIQGMNMEQTEVAILSACETGLGKIEVGEGVYGLQRAFKIAGVDKLIMSLWKVDDEATQKLFSEFYKKWIKQGKEVTVAFKAAQEEIRKEYTDPYYWGAFVLIN